MAELKRLNEDWIVKKLAEAHEAARRQIDERATDLLRLLRDAVRALPLHLGEIEGALAVWVKEFEAPKSAALTRLYGARVDLSGYNTCVPLFSEDESIDLKPGRYRFILTAVRVDDEPAQ